MGEPALHIRDSAGPHTLSISRGHQFANLERFEDKLRFHLWYGISKP